MNFRVSFNNGTAEQFFGDDDRYRLLKGGGLRLDVNVEGRPLRRYYSSTAWLEVNDLEPVYEDNDYE